MNFNIVAYARELIVPGTEKIKDIDIEACNINSPAAVIDEYDATLADIINQNVSGKEVLLLPETLWTKNKSEKVGEQKQCQVYGIT